MRWTARCIQASEELEHCRGVATEVYVGSAGCDVDDSTCHDSGQTPSTLFAYDVAWSQWGWKVDPTLQACCISNQSAGLVDHDRQPSHSDCLDLLPPA